MPVPTDSGDANVRPVPRDSVLEEIVVGGRRWAIVRPRDLTAHPYWARVWPGSLVLADELLSRDLEGVRVLELGCGLGIGAIAASAAGAEAVATDIDEDALAFARENARRILGYELDTMALDLKTLDADSLGREPYELVIAAEVLYSPGLISAVADGLTRIVAAGGEALVVHAFTQQADELIDRLGWPARRWESGGRHLASLTRP
jgi:predicted nicotinamide N-methyase